MKKILIMGLPGSGKTTLASKLVSLINTKWLNTDEVRKTVDTNAMFVKSEKYDYHITTQDAENLAP